MIDHGFRRALFLGAHPDDEMGCAGTIMRLVANGTEVSGLTFSDCSDLNDGARLRAEWLSAMTYLGVRALPRQWSVPNRQFPEYRQNVLGLLDEYRLDGYDLVLCPSPTDAHQDHATVTAEAIRVFKYATILGYELPINAVRSLSPNGFVVLDQRLVERKVEHADLYASQASKPYMAADYIRSLARVRGVQAGAQYAEGFEVVRWVA